MAQRGRTVKMTFRREINKLHAQGKSIRKIGEALGLARNTVRRYLRELDPLPLPSPGNRGWAGSLDWELILKQNRSGIQINQLHQDHAPPGVSLSAFYRRFSVVNQTAPTVALVLTHKAGEKVQVDYTDGVLVYDDKGNARKTQLFCGVLPYSGYTFGEFTFDQKQGSFLRSHENMWSFLGGVTEYVVIDNLKSGVSRAHRYDPEVNPTYCDFGNHYGFAVLPARPRTPRDKASVESNIGAIQRSFFQEVHARRFQSLAELNVAFRTFLNRFNNRLMKEHGVSRWERFQNEKKALQALPPIRYDLREWKTAKVHPDCHVQVQNCFYSVPFRLVGQEVRVRMSDTLVEVFDVECKAVAAHHRLDGRGRRATLDAHLPDDKLQASRFEIRQALAKADSIGIEFSDLMQKLLGGLRPLTHLRRAQGILRLLGKDGIDASAMNYAAGQCLTFRKYRLDFFKGCALSWSRARRNSENTAPTRVNEHMCLINTQQN